MQFPNYSWGLEGDFAVQRSKPLAADAMAGFTLLLCNPWLFLAAMEVGPSQVSGVVVPRWLLHNAAAVSESRSKRCSA